MSLHNKLDWRSQAAHFGECLLAYLVGIFWIGGITAGIYGGICVTLAKEGASSYTWFANERPADMTIPEGFFSSHMIGEYKDVAFHTAGFLIPALVHDLILVIL